MRRVPWTRLVARATAETRLEQAGEGRQAAPHACLTQAAEQR